LRLTEIDKKIKSDFNMSFGDNAEQRTCIFFV